MRASSKIEHPTSSTVPLLYPLAADPRSLPRAGLGAVACPCASDSRVCDDCRVVHSKHLVYILSIGRGMASVHLCRDELAIKSLREDFEADGFVVFHDAVCPSLVSTLQSRLEDVLRGEFNRNAAPDKMPKHMMNRKKNKQAAPLGYDGKSQNSRVLQIINIHKCDEAYRQLAISPEIGRMVAELAGWEHGARLAQDQVWAKPPGAPPLVFHRDSPYFMFTPTDVVTVWVALDDMDEEVGPLQYVKGSHKWGDARVGSSATFFQSDNRKLLYSAAKLEGVPESELDIISLAGMKAGGISIHNGRTWHGSGKNNSNRPRRGLGLHFVPGNIKFTSDARKSKLWRSYVPDDVRDEELENVAISEDDFPLVWKQPS